MRSVFRLRIVKLTDAQFEASVRFPCSHAIAKYLATDRQRTAVPSLWSDGRACPLAWELITFRQRNYKISQSRVAKTRRHSKYWNTKYRIQSMTRRIFIGNGLSRASHSSPVKLCGRTSKTRLSCASNRSRASVSRQKLHGSWAQMKCEPNCVPVSFTLTNMSTHVSYTWYFICHISIFYDVIIRYRHKMTFWCAKNVVC